MGSGYGLSASHASDSWAATVPFIFEQDLQCFLQHHLEEVGFTNTSIRYWLPMLELSTLSTHAYYLSLQLLHCKWTPKTHI